MAGVDLVAGLTSLLAPAACVACRAPVAGGEALCPRCRRDLPWLADPCARCGLPGHGARCPRPPAGLARAWAPLAYSGPARAVVLGLKYRAALPLASLMAAQVAANLPLELRGEGIVVVPVPAHPGRRRVRGFDPVALLARVVAARTGLPVSACLRREDAALRQVGASRGARLRGDRLILSVRGPVPARALLLDDVITTGATLSACAAALLAGGAGWVAGAAYARAL